MGQFENISYNSEFHAQKQSSGNWILKKLKKDRLLNTIWLEASGTNRPMVLECSSESSRCSIVLVGPFLICRPKSRVLN